MWDELSNFFYINYIYNYFYTIFFVIIDRGILEVLGPTGLINTFSNIFVMFTRIQTGFLYHYAFYMVFGLGFVFFSFMLLFFGFGLEYILFFILLLAFFLLC